MKPDIFTLYWEDVLLLDQNDQGEVTFTLAPKANLSGNISAFTLIRSEVFGNTLKDS